LNYRINPEWVSSKGGSNQVYINVEIEN